MLLLTVHKARNGGLRGVRDGVLGLHEAVHRDAHHAIVAVVWLASLDGHRVLGNTTPRHAAEVPVGLAGLATVRGDIQVGVTEYGRDGDEHTRVGRRDHVGGVVLVVGLVHKPHDGHTIQQLHRRRERLVQRCGDCEGGIGTAVHANVHDARPADLHTRLAIRQLVVLYVHHVVEEGVGPPLEGVDAVGGSVVGRR